MSGKKYDEVILRQDQMEEKKYMKTIKQIADELVISKQKAARYIKSNNLYVSRNGSLIHIDDTVETLMKQLQEKDNQIKSLLEKLDQEQKLHLATIQDKQQLQIELKEIKKENKQENLSIWNKIFGKK